MSGEKRQNSGGNTHPNYDGNNRHLSYSNYQTFPHFSNGDINYQPYDNNNYLHSYGDFNHRNFDNINRPPFYGDIYHRTCDEKTRHPSRGVNYHQFDECTRQT